MVLAQQYNPVSQWVPLNASDYQGLLTTTSGNGRPVPGPMNIFLGRITNRPVASKDLVDGTMMLVKGYLGSDIRLHLLVFLLLIPPTHLT